MSDPDPARAEGGRTSGAALLPWLATAGRLLLGGVMLVAGGLKIADPAAAVRAVRAYQLVPEAFVPPVAFGLPVVEVAIGLALLAGLFVRAAAVASAVMLLLFMAGVVAAWARGLQIDCGCFGGGGQVGAADTAYPEEILRDTALLAVALLLARRPRSRLALGSAGRSGTTPDGAAPTGVPTLLEETRGR